MRLPRPAPRRRGTAPYRRSWQPDSVAVSRWWSYQPQLGEGRGDPVVLIGEELLELRTGHESIGPAVLHQRLLPLLRAVQVFEHFDHLLLGIIGNARWRKNSAPVRECEIDAGLFQGRRIDALDALVARHRKHAKLAGFDLIDELTRAGGADGDLLAEQCGEQI